MVRAGPRVTGGSGPISGCAFGQSGGSNVRDPASFRGKMGRERGRMGPVTFPFPPTIPGKGTCKVGKGREKVFRGKKVEVVLAGEVALVEGDDGDFGKRCCSFAQHGFEKCVDGG